MDKDQPIRKEVMFLYAMTTITRKSVIRLRVCGISLFN